LNTKDSSNKKEESTQSVSYLFEPPPIPTIRIVDSPLLFPVHRIYCVTLNDATYRMADNYHYHHHHHKNSKDEQAMKDQKNNTNNTATTNTKHSNELPYTTPSFFMKPAYTIVDCTRNSRNTTTPITQISYPTGTGENIQYEIELVIAIGKGGRNISQAEAFHYIYGFTVGCDLTKHERLKQMKHHQLPWECAKAFDHSTPIGAIIPYQFIVNYKRSMYWTLRKLINQVIYGYR
jgi:fumarylpyruvate hydrolase